MNKINLDEMISVAEALDEFSSIDEAEGGNPLVIETERRAAELLRHAERLLFRAHNSDSAEPVACGEKPKALADAILSLAKDGGGTRDLSFNAGLLAALKVAEPLYLASPPAKEAEELVTLRAAFGQIRALTRELMDGFDYVGTGSYRTAEKEAKEHELRFSSICALTNRTPDDEVGNG